MSELAAYLKKKIKLAAKSVWYHRTQYLCFFIAMLVTEIFCGLVVIAAHNNNLIEYRYVSNEYDYHLELLNLNTDQYYYMLNDEYTAFSADHIYDVVGTEKRVNDVTGNTSYNMYIKFLGDPKTNYNTFSKRYFNDLTALDESGKLSISTTTLYNFENRVSANTVGNVGTFLLITLLSVGLVTALYNIRINYYKFEYGIYMSFGADFRRLFVTSLWEMIVVAVAVYIPAVLISAGMSYAIYTAVGESFEFYAAAPFIMLAFAVIVSGVSVLLPIWRLSRRTPMSNIIAEDNSNLTVSPRISFEMLGKKYPRGYELISAWRFRLYNLRLFATAALFTALFVVTIYIAGLISQNDNLSLEQFTVNFTAGGTYSYDGGTEGSYMHDELLAVPGVTGVTKKQVVYADKTSSHVLFDKSEVAFGSNYVIFTGDENLRATNFAEYHPTDSEVIAQLSQYSYDGDLNSVLTDEKTVIISDSSSNIKKLKIKPGDKIQVAKYASKITDPTDFLSGNQLLKEELRLYSFDYTEYIVGAVIHNLPTGNNLAIYFSNSDFTAQTDIAVEYNTVGIYVDQSLTTEEVKTLETQLREWADHYSNASVSNTHALSEKNLTLAKNGTAFMLCIAALLLTVTPLMWFLSQVLFYLKRENEFTVLLAMGGLMREVKRQHLIDGFIALVCGGLILTFLTWALLFAVYIATNQFFVPFNSIPLRYIFEIPWLTAVIGGAVGLASAFLSCYIPYLLFYRRARIASAAEYSGE
jgi:ABC-type transport system, involved in lipoprotein release, permease component